MSLGECLGAVCLGGGGLVSEVSLSLMLSEDGFLFSMNLESVSVLHSLE